MIARTRPTTIDPKCAISVMQWERADLLSLINERGPPATLELLESSAALETVELEFEGEGEKGERARGKEAVRRRPSLGSAAGVVLAQQLVAAAACSEGGVCKSKAHTEEEEGEKERKNYWSWKEVAAAA